MAAEPKDWTDELARGSDTSSKPGAPAVVLSAEGQFEAYGSGFQREGIRLTMFLRIYRFLNDRRRDALSDLNVAPGFFQTVLTALRTSVDTQNRP